MIPLLPMDPLELAHAFDRTLSFTDHVMSIDATKKRKVDGTLAATRLGQAATEKWANERFRQVMLLVLEFRKARDTLLTNDDVESIRLAVDNALFVATSEGHVGDIYDLNATSVKKIFREHFMTCLHIVSH